MADVLSFMETVGKLKTTKRTGWVRSGIQLPESVADHSYRMAMLSTMILDPGINKGRLQKICLVHDLAESIVGDITPYCNVTVEDKHAREQSAMRDIVSAINNKAIGDEILALWMEYEDRLTPESQVAYQLDKFEMIYQADEYERSQGVLLDDFFQSTIDAFTHTEVLQWATALRDRRSERLQLDMSATS